jgi:hypothetical protein
LCGKVDFSVTLHPGARCKHLYCTGIALYSFIKSAVAKAKMFPHLEAWVQRTKRLYLIFHGLVALKIKLKIAYYMLNYLSAFVCCVQIHREQRNSEKNERERERPLPKSLVLKKSDVQSSTAFSFAFVHPWLLLCSAEAETDRSQGGGSGSHKVPV